MAFTVTYNEPVNVGSAMLMSGTATADDTSGSIKTKLSQILICGICPTTANAHDWSMDYTTTAGTIAVTSSVNAETAGWWAIGYD